MRRLVTIVAVAGGLVLAGCGDSSPAELPSLDSTAARCAELSDDAQHSLAAWRDQAGPFAPERQIENIVYDNKLMADLGCPPSDTVEVPTTTG